MPANNGEPRLGFVREHAGPPVHDALFNDHVGVGIAFQLFCDEDRGVQRQLRPLVLSMRNERVGHIRRHHLTQNLTNALRV